MTGRAPKGRPRSARLALKIYLYVTATLVVIITFLGVTAWFIGPPKGAAPPPIHVVILPIALFCCCLVFTSLLFARSLVKPIRQLSQVAEALGSGNMEERVRLNRRDELGDLGRSFDQMADRIVHLLRSQRELMANVSHELRTPLARIRVALDIAAEGDDDKAREQLGEIAEDLGEIERLVSDILMAARLNVGTKGTSLSAPPTLLWLQASRLCQQRP